MADVQEKVRVEVELTREQVRLIDQAVRDGDFTSRSDAVVHAIEEWRTKSTLADHTDEELGRLWDEGIASGEPIPADNVFQRLRERVTKRLSDDEANNPA